MDKLVKGTTQITIENENCLTISSKDKFMNVNIYFPKNLNLSKTGNQLYLLSALKFGSQNNIKQVNNIFISTLFVTTIDTVIDTLKKDPTMYLNNCLSKTGGGFTLELSLYEVPLYIKFNIHAKYKSITGTPKAWEIFKSKHNKLPNITHFIDDYQLENDDISLDFKNKLYTDKKINEIENIFKNEIEKKELPVNVSLKQ